jgi:deazaflavin-dependent oxidoreductase (nitroreductase family)
MAAISFKNKVPALLLRSPLHPLLSGRYALLSFTGRRTGRVYTTPVAYARHGQDRLVLSTDSRWWRNLAGGAAVTVRLAGADRPGRAMPLGDRDRAEAELHRLVGTIGSYARWAGIRLGRDRRPALGEVARVLDEGRVVVEVQLQRAGRQ